MANENGWWKAALIAVVCQVCLYYSDLYDLRIVADRRELFVRALQSLGAASLILAVLYYLVPGPQSSAAASSSSPPPSSSLIIVGWRVAFEWLAKRARPAERLLLVGTGRGRGRPGRELHERRQELGVEIVGFVDPDAAQVGGVAASTRASSGRSTTSRPSSATATSTGSS